MKNGGEFLKNGAIQGVLLLNAFIMVYPLFVMVISSFKTNAEIFTSPFALPTAQSKKDRDEKPFVPPSKRGTNPTSKPRKGRSRAAK